MHGLVKALIGAVALVAAAWLLGAQIASIRTADRTVQVRGAAEIPATADLATWSLNVTVSGDDLAAVQQDMNASLAKIRAFLAQHGIKPNELENAGLSVNDARANPYSNNASGVRFTVQGGVMVRTANLTGIAEAKNALGDLVGQGVVLTNSYGPNYQFTKLNEAKPQLIAEATKAARAAAEQFAKDSGAQVGGIRRAAQGSVQILGRDSFLGENEQPQKILRVVTTVDYDLN